MIEGVSNCRSSQETFKHNIPWQVSDLQSWWSSQGRGRGSVKGRGRGRSKGNNYTGRGDQGPSFQCEGENLYTKKSILEKTIENCLLIKRMRLDLHASNNKCHNKRTKIVYERHVHKQNNI